MVAESHHRRSIRLDGYDYTQPGAYYVTVVCHDRLEVFGEVAGGEVRLSPLGQIAQNEWVRLFARFPFLVEDLFVVMPNHIHGILVINHPSGGGSPSLVGACPNRMVGAWRGLQSTLKSVPEAVPQHGQDRGTASGIINHVEGKPRHAPTIANRRNFSEAESGSIPTIVGAYKSAVTNRGRGLRIIPPGLPVWQRNYYEHIIRDEVHLARLRQYILDNPLRWDTDEENPDCQP